MKRALRTTRAAIALHGLVIASCQPATEKEVPSIELALPLTHSDCDVVTPPIVSTGGNYGSCTELFAAGEANFEPLGPNECYRIELGRRLRCRNFRALVIPTYQGLDGLANVFNLDVETELEDLVDWFNVGSYGQFVFDYEVVGGLTNGRAAWLAADVRSFADVNTLATLVDAGLTEYPLQDYDAIIWLTTQEGRPATGSIAAEIPAASGAFHWNGPSIVLKNLNQSSRFRYIARHELGHAINLGHSDGPSSLTGYDTDDYFDFTGRFISYYDEASPMGLNRGHYDAIEKERLGWLPSELIYDLAAGVSEKVTVGSLDTAIQKIKAVRIPAASGTYWVDAPRGGDLKHNLAEGVIVRFEGPVGIDGAEGVWTLDATRDTPAERLEDGALMVGRTFSDTVRDVYITVTSATESQSVIDVQVSPTNPSAPEIHNIVMTNCSGTFCTGALSEQDDAIGPTFMFSVDASDADGDPLSIFWNFEVGNGDYYVPGSFGSGTTVRHRFIDATPRRVRVLVSDRRGGLASSHVDLPGYVAAAPVVLDVTSKQVGESSFQLIPEIEDDELITTSWTIEGVTSRWREPRHEFATTPDCVEVALRVGDRVQTAPWNGCVALNHNPVADLVVTRAINGQPPIGGASFGEQLLLDAGGSSDADSDPLTYSWSDTCGLLSGNETLGFVIFPFNTRLPCTFTVTVSDGSWTSTDSVLVMSGAGWPL